MARPPRPPNRLDPVAIVLPAGTTLFRVHRPPHTTPREPGESAGYAANAFNPGNGGQTRFAPIADRSGRPVPTLYAATSAEAALFESVFHDVPARRSRQTELAGKLVGRDDLVERGMRAVSYKRRIRGRALTPLIVLRDLSLVQLHDIGLDRLGVTAELTGGPPTRYARTREWAAALHRHGKGFEGLIWMSRRFNSEKTAVLFGDRVSTDDLRIGSPSLPLDRGTGMAIVYELAERARVTVTHD